MKQVLSIAAGALLLSAVSVNAQSFEFEIKGDGQLEANVNYTEELKLTETEGAEFGFTGGAGSEYDANANGAIAAAGGVNGQFAGGIGTALSNTDDGGFAAAEYNAGSFAASGGYATDVAVDDWARAKGDGLVLAGGAGSTETGSSTGYKIELDQSLLANLKFDYTETTAVTIP